MKPDFNRGIQETKDGVQLSICCTPRKRSINLSRKCGLTREIADQTSENIFFFFLKSARSSGASCKKEWSTRARPASNAGGLAQPQLS